MGKRKRKKGYKADYGDATPEQVALALLTYRRPSEPVDSAAEPSKKQAPKRKG